jgi:hypothetical protein
MSKIQILKAIHNHVGGKEISSLSEKEMTAFRWLGRPDGQPSRQTFGRTTAACSRGACLGFQTTLLTLSDFRWYMCSWEVKLFFYPIFIYSIMNFLSYNCMLHKNFCPIFAVDKFKCRKDEKEVYFNKSGHTAESIIYAVYL